MIGFNHSQQLHEVSGLKGQQKEYWMHLCEQAANEQDPDRLMALVREINHLLEEKEIRLKREAERDSAPGK